MDWKLSFDRAKNFSHPDTPLYRDRCLHTERAYRRYRRTDGRDEVRHQCLSCGDRASVIPKAQATAQGIFVDQLPDCEPELTEKLSEASQRNSAARLEKWFSVYQNYLQSQEWRSIRERVLARDRHRCQGCLQEDAIEAHHLTYANIGDEFLFELVAIGKRCQGRLRLSTNEIPR